LDRLKEDPTEWDRLRRFLKQNREKMDVCVVNGTDPVFDYPLMSFGPIQDPSTDGLEYKTEEQIKD
jgi:hypothetical protein